MKNKNFLLANKFSTPLQAIPFTSIEIDDYKPAFEEAIRIAREEIKVIFENKTTPDFYNTIEALEKSGKKLSLIKSIFFNLNSAATSKKMQEIAQEISPVLTDFSNDIFLNKDLFFRVHSVYSEHKQLTLNTEQGRLLEDTYLSFIRRGANLTTVEQEKFRMISKELSALTLKFSENNLNETAEFRMNINQKGELKGLPDHVIEAASDLAKKEAYDGWVFTLQSPSYVPFMQYADSRKLREKIHKAFNTLGNNNNKYNNRDNIKKIVDFRRQLANLLGYKNYAEYILERRMAEKSEKVYSFLYELLDVAYPAAKKEYIEVQQFAERKGLKEKVQRWDWAYFSEKLKLEKFNVDDEMTRPYFQLENVCKGVFDLANKLYGLELIENKDIPVYDPEVKVYEVYRKNKFIALLYLDFFPRENKQQGAWMTTYKDQHREDNEDLRSHVSLVFNFTRPTKTKPSLITFREVETFLHEFGHGLHSILSECNYSSLSGTSVYWDFVELPSQIMENWANEDEWIDSIAIHYKTGEKIPEILMKNIVASSNFQSGYAFVRQISFGLNDMAWHSINEEIKENIEEFEKKAIAPAELLPKTEGCLISTQFRHIFSGGYAAGYYSYKWAEVLDADAFSVFKKKGIFNRDVAESFRLNILSKGGTEHPMTLYKRFRGSEPSPKALLKRSGLIT